MTSISTRSPGAQAHKKPGGGAPAAQATRHRSGLRANALGFPTVLAESIGVISPTMTSVLIVPLAFADAGQGAWLAYAFGAIMLMFVVFGLNQFARRSASAGSMYAYTARGLGPTTGVLSGWALIWAYLFIAIAGLSGFAIFAQQFLSSTGAGITVPPVLLFVLSGAVCWYVAYRDIHISSALTLVLEALSVSCIASLAGIVLFKHGFSVDTSQVQLKGMSLHGLSLAVVISIFSLVGFESATALGSEAKRPLHNVPRAVFWSLAFAGLFFVFITYVEVAGTSHDHTSLANMSAPLNVLAKLYGVTAFRAPISLGAMVSFFGLTLTCLNAGARIIYRMAGHDVLPKALHRAHPHNRTPYVAIIGYIALILTVPLLLEVFTNPLTIFGDAGTLAAFGFLLAYFLISLAAPAYLSKIGQLKGGHVAMAVLAFLLLLVPTIGSFYPVPSFPVSIFPYIFLTYVALGSAWLYVVSQRKPGILGELALDLASHPTTLERDVAAEEVLPDDITTGGTIDLVAAAAKEQGPADLDKGWAAEPA
jgi:amino acid transporter